MEESVDSWEHFAICTSSSTTRHSWHRGVLAMGFITVKQQLLIHANSHNQRELVPLVFASVLTLIAQGTRLVLPAPSATRLHDEDVESSSMPWGWVVSVVMLLVLISNRLHPIFVIAIVFLYVYFFISVIKQC